MANFQIFYTMKSSFELILNGEHKVCQINSTPMPNPATGKEECSYTLYDIGEYGFAENPVEYSGDSAPLLEGHKEFLNQGTKYYLTLSGNIMVSHSVKLGWFSSPGGRFLRFLSSWEESDLPERMTEIKLADPANFTFEEPLQWQPICMNKKKDVMFFLRSHGRDTEFLRLHAKWGFCSYGPYPLIGATQEIFCTHHDNENLVAGEYGVIDQFGEKCTLEEILKQRPAGGIKTRLKSLGVEYLTLNTRRICGRGGNR